ncbi:BlaI/MecI/CopY family transcriptional regulator [Amycolatopsis roodepoortensis]|uniref:BlaI/MecI/CopY family transcriptional regulator n=1 Tax=Amycolatopsis roodepoortensis TaxID=700274 RepID=UPI00214ADAA4|nr:BlaI/MecI/CopY family transcriptional regulator [Amycolatopsis roodepoortensis]UUV35871.1 BlaI/MecI/CopY family transcriptional regulator [Amycolatopsis roodepoortensis]
MQGLGELESAVMDVLWQAEGPLTVRGVLGVVNQRRELAYTTVMTVLDNLHRKEWVSRSMQNRAYLYTPVMSREEAAAQALRTLLADTDDPESVLLHFAASASDGERDALRRGLRKRPRP